MGYFLNHEPMTTSWCLREYIAGGITFCCILFFVTISWWRQAFSHQWCSYSEWILRRCQNRCRPSDRRAVTFWPVKTTNHRKITVCWFIFYQELNLIILYRLFHSSINEFNATSLTPFLSEIWCFCYLLTKIHNIFFIACFYCCFRQHIYYYFSS